MAPVGSTGGVADGVGPAAKGALVGGVPVSVGVCGMWVVIVMGVIIVVVMGGGLVSIM